MANIIEYEYKSCFDINFSNYVFKYGSVSCLFDTGSDMCVWKGTEENFIKIFSNSIKTKHVAKLGAYNGIITIAAIYLVTSRFKYLTCKDTPVAVGINRPIDSKSRVSLTISPRTIFRGISLKYDVDNDEMLIGLPKDIKYYNRKALLNYDSNNVINNIKVVNEEINIAPDTCPVCGSKLLSIGRCVNPECYFEL